MGRVHRQPDPPLLRREGSLSKSEWEKTPYNAAAKKRSIAEARERIQQEIREEEERAALCQCDTPIPGYMVMGQRPCVACRRFIG